MMKHTVIAIQVKVQRRICLMRKVALINSYDTVMIRTKGYVFRSERVMDSLDQLIVHGAAWETNKNNRAYAEKVKAMDKLFAYNVKICKQLARMSETSFNEDSVFNAQQEQYEAWNDSLIAQNKKLVGSYRSYYDGLRY